MRIYKKIIGAVLLGGAMLLCAGCSADFFKNNKASEIINSVNMPAQYNIAYEVKGAGGVIRTVEKTVDSEGNIYFNSGEKELLYIKEGNGYKLYTKDENGEFVADDNGASYTKSFVDTETSEFLNYAEKSRNQFIPGAESKGEEEKNGRTCLVYEIKLGGDDNSLTYNFYVDKETGICLGWDEAGKVAGINLDASGEVFSCSKFITEDIASLKVLIEAQ